MSFYAPLRPLAGLAALAGLLFLPGCATLERLAARVGDDRPAPAATAKPPAISPRTLVGNTEEQLEAMLGKPASVREEPPAMVWRYRANDTCSVDVFLYFDLASEAFRSLAYKFHLKKSGRPQEQETNCMAALRAARQTATDGKR